MFLERLEILVYRFSVYFLSGFYDGLQIDYAFATYRSVMTLYPRRFSFMFFHYEPPAILELLEM